MALKCWCVFQAFDALPCDADGTVKPGGFEAKLSVRGLQANSVVVDPNTGAVRFGTDDDCDTSTFGPSDLTQVTIDGEAVWVLQLSLPSNFDGTDATNAAKLALEPVGTEYMLDVQAAGRRTKFEFQLDATFDYSPFYIPAVGAECFPISQVSTNTALPVAESLQARIDAAVCCTVELGDWTNGTEYVRVLRDLKTNAVTMFNRRTGAPHTGGLTGYVPG